MIHVFSRHNEKVNSKTILLVGLFLITNLSTIISQNVKCNRNAIFGDKEICLPNINGYQECYSDPIVKQLADATEVPINSVLGFYLSDEIYAKRDSLGLINFDNYFKIYGTKEIQNYSADGNFLEQMLQLLSGNFIEKNWQEVSKEIDKTGFDVEIGVPIVIEKYSINDESFTMVILTKYEIEGIEPYTLATTINGYLKNKRLIWMAYYLNYKEQETIELLKSKSNFILKELTDAGK